MSTDPPPNALAATVDQLMAELGLDQTTELTTTAQYWWTGSGGVAATLTLAGGEKFGFDGCYRVWYAEGRWQHDLWIDLFRDPRVILEHPQSFPIASPRAFGADGRVLNSFAGHEHTGVAQVPLDLIAEWRVILSTGPELDSACPGCGEPHPGCVRWWRDDPPVYCPRCGETLPRMRR